jgi:hypothetical protein
MRIRDQGKPAGRIILPGYIFGRMINPGKQEKTDHRGVIRKSANHNSSYANLKLWDSPA